jgi:hypothetical protein
MNKFMSDMKFQVGDVVRYRGKPYSVHAVVGEMLSLISMCERKWCVFIPKGEVR